MTEPLRIFVGYDSREPTAYHVFAHSILKRASRPVAIIPLVQSQLRAAGIYTRPVDTKASTEFSLTRFLVPYLAGYEGLAIFADCDMLARADICEVLDERDWDAVVSVCQHDYAPKNATKMDGQPNAAYPRKNWSSLMLFDCSLASDLTPEYVNTATPAELHRFAWLGDDQIGSLPLEWNWLVGEYEPNPDAKILHYTEGGPWFRDYQDCDHAEDWRREYAEIALPAGLWSRDAWFSHGPHGTSSETITIR